MMGPWTIHSAHLAGYGPVGCGNASCEPIELQPCRSKYFLSSHLYYVDSMKMSAHVAFVAPQTSALAETMVKRPLEGISLT